MLDHPWMKLDLSGKGNDNLNITKAQLSKYVSVRKEQSQRFKQENGGAGADIDEDN